MHALKPRQSRLFGAIFLTFFTVFWNAPTSVFVVFASAMVLGVFNNGDRVDGPEFWIAIGLLVFMVPFILVGILTACLAVAEVLALFGPKPIVSVDQATVGRGQRLSLSLEIKGSPTAFKAVEVRLTGREETRVTVGTRTRTDTHVFHTETVGKIDPQSLIDPWFGSVRIPQHTRPSFNEGRNEVLWAIVVETRHGLLPKREDLFVITVT